MAIRSLAISENSTSLQEIKINSEKSPQNYFKINQRTPIKSRMQNYIETSDKSTLKPKKQVTQTVGDTRLFWVLNLKRSWELNEWIYEEINATLILEGAHSQIYTDLTVDSILSNVIQAINTSFETIIYPTITGVYGLPPDIDSNGKIIILLFDIIDGQGSSSYVAGFFDSNHETQNFKYSEKAEILHIDANEGLPHLKAGEFETIAHEFQHMIHYYHDYEENIWLDEAASMLAEYLIGENPFDGTDPYQPAFESHPDVSLTYWDYYGTPGLVFANYGASFAFFLYLLEKYNGTNSIQNIVRRSGDQGHGILSIEQALHSEGYQVEFKDVFRNWTIANYLDDLEIDKAFYYENIDLSMDHDHSVYYSSSVPRSENSVPYWGTDYLKFADRTNVPFILEFQGKFSSDFMVTAIFSNTSTIPSNTEVIPIEISADQFGNFSTEAYGISADEIVLIISSYTPIGQFDHDDEYPAPAQDYWFMINPQGLVINPGDISFSSKKPVLFIQNIEVYDQSGIYWKEADGATYTILTDSGDSTGISGNLTFNSEANFWESNAIDISPLLIRNNTYRIKYHFFNSTCSGIAFSETFEINQTYTTQSSNSTATEDTSRTPGFMLVISVMTIVILISNRKRKREKMK